MTPWTVAHQAPLSMGFSRQEYWSGLPCPSPGDLPGPGIKPRSPELQVNSLLSEPPGKPSGKYYFASLRVCFWDSRYPDMTQGGANKGQARWGDTKRGPSPVAQRKRILLQCRRCRRLRFDTWVGKIPWSKA